MSFTQMPLLDKESYISTFTPSSTLEKSVNRFTDTRDALAASYHSDLESGNAILESQRHDTNGKLRSSHMEADLGNPYFLSSRLIQSTAPFCPSKSIVRQINQDITVEFKGKAILKERIRWTENARTQIIGFCMTMLGLGITIAFSSYRWIGIIAGSLNTIACGLAVIVTYAKRKQWHQHPNPIVHNRAVLGVFLAICLLLNVALEYTVSPENDRNCQRLAGATEFFFFTSEAWGLVMACDLYFSLNSPFTSYKRMMRFYHVYVWIGGIIMGGITWNVRGAGGFFKVDAKSVTYGSSLSDVVGFCMASSRICCPDSKNCDLSRYSLCSAHANFLTTQFWPWILMYTIVIVVLVVSVAVLSLAWHRLYLRGAPKTYHIRLHVLNYISFFTGSCVFYWLLLLLLYMSSYFVSVNSDSDNASAQVLRQLVAFFVSSKGYLDFAIWFAINRSVKLDSDSVETDKVDLSPQVNMALRSEILYYTTFGIKASIQSCKDEEISIPMFGDDDKKHVKFWSYCPAVFRSIRKAHGITDASYAQMFSTTTKEQFSEGRSGAFMFFTGDEELIVKTMSQEECTFLCKIAHAYESYMTENTDSLLTRFYGCHSVSLYNNVYHFVVMGNLFAETQFIHHRYDIKGSWVARNAKVPKPGDKTICRYCNASYTFGCLNNKDCGDGITFHEPDIVLRDNDLMAKIRIDLPQATRMYEQIHQDSEFLCEQGIMDYSLLIGIQSCEYYVETQMPRKLTTSSRPSTYSHPASSVAGPSVYHFGIIDILQQWTLQKKLERLYKCQIERKDPNGISAMPPKPYKARFQQAMSRVFALYHPETIRKCRTQPALVEMIDHSEFTSTRLAASRYVGQ